MTTANGKHAAELKMKSDIASALRLLMRPGDVFELRALKVPNGQWRPKTFSGYFDYASINKAAGLAFQLSDVAKASGVYVTINPLKNELLARRMNHTAEVTEGDATTDGNVLRRAWLPIDADPKRESGISATDAEKELALAVARDIRAFLRERGWPDPILADSANGAHLPYRIDLPADDGGLVGKVLQALHQRFSTDHVSVDTTVKNASRIWKLYGTYARKGEDAPTLGRPHRRARLLEVPGCADPNDTAQANVQAVPVELLESLAAEAKDAPPKSGATNGRGHAWSNGATTNGNGDFGHKLMVAEYLKACSVDYRLKDGPGTGDKTYVLEACPFNKAHTAPDSCVFQFANGATDFKCSHNSCSGNRWQEFKNAVGKPDRDHYDPPIPSPKPKQKKHSKKKEVNPTPTASVNGTLDAAGDESAADDDSGYVEEAIDDPHALARYYLMFNATAQTNGDRLRYYQEKFWEWSGTRFKAAPEAELKARLTKFVKLRLDKEYPAWAKANQGDGPPITVPKVTPHLIACVQGALAGDSLVPATTPQPSWLGDPPANRSYIALLNGLLDVDALLAGKETYLLPHSPLWFSPNCLPYDFVPDADCPKWKAFLDRNLAGDTDMARLLQQWFGYNLLHDTSRQRFLMMTGNGANGKSVVCAVLTALLGEENISTVPLEFFGERFRLHGTIGKLANIAAEVGELDKMAEGQLKAFVVGDAMEFEVKYHQPFTAVPTARLTLAANNFPHFSDKTDGIWRRLILFPFSVQIPPSEQTPGMDKPDWWRAAGEMPGILWWALCGLLDLRQSGGFVIPKVCRDSANRLRQDNNPPRSFLVEHYEAGEEKDILLKQELYEAFTKWCQATGHTRPVCRERFGEEVKRLFPEAIDGKIGPRKHRENVYKGIRERIDDEGDEKV